MPLDAPASEILAHQLFVAELGSTGLTWDSLSEATQDEYKRKVGRMLEGLWHRGRPLVVIDMEYDTIELCTRDSLT